jgi:hypothetical protein
VTANGLLLVATALTCLWTYSRTGIAGMLASIGLAVVIDRIATRRPGGRLLGISPAPVLLVGLVVAGTLGLGILEDPGSAQRISTIGDVTISSGPDSTDTTPSDVQTAAIRAQDIRLRLQKAAVSETLHSVRTALIGPGLGDFERNTHNPSSRDFVAQAAGVRDPNSSWLSIGLAGGLPAVLFFALILLAGLLAAVRAIRSTTGVSREIAIWLAAWLVVWAGAQVFGTYPFATSESVLLGVLLGVAAALLPRTAARGEVRASVG